MRCTLSSLVGCPDHGKDKWDRSIFRSRLGDLAKASVGLSRCMATVLLLFTIVVINLVVAEMHILKLRPLEKNRGQDSFILGNVVIFFGHGKTKRNLPGG